MTEKGLIDVICHNGEICFFYKDNLNRDRLKYVKARQLRGKRFDKGYIDIDGLKIDLKNIFEVSYSGRSKIISMAELKEILRGVK